MRSLPDKSHKRSEAFGGGGGGGGEWNHIRIIAGSQAGIQQNSNRDTEGFTGDRQRITK